MILPVQHLDWDSEFFGYRIGRVEADAIDDIDGILVGARNMGFELIYCEIPAEKMTLVRYIEASGHEPVCTRVELRCELAGRTSRMPPDVEQVTEASASDDLERLVRLAQLAGWTSRFRSDDRISNEKVDLMYRRWLERSIAGELADEVLAYRDSSEIAGMITLTKREECAEIGLFAVGEAFRRKGIGRILLEAAQGFAVRNDCRNLSVATQMENEPAMASYIKAGFEVSSRKPTYHFWINHGVVASNARRNDQTD